MRRYGYHLLTPLGWFTDDDVAGVSFAISSNPVAWIVSWNFSLCIICVCIRRWIRIKINDKYSLCVNYILQLHITFFCSHLLRHSDYIELHAGNESLLSWYYLYGDFSSIEIRFLSAHDCRKRKRKIHMTILYLATNIASFIVIVTSYLSNYNNLKFMFSEKSKNKRKKLILCSFMSRMFWNIQVVIHFIA